MKFLALVLSTTALAFPLFGRGTSSVESSTQCVADITSDAYKIGNQTSKVGATANKVKANTILTLLTLQSETTSLIKTLQAAGNAVNSSCPDLTLSEALPLVTVLQGLLTPVNSTMTTLINKKSTFDHAVLYFFSLSWLVKSDLNSVVTAVYGFAYACKAKTPATAAQIVDNLIAEIMAPILQAQSTYAGSSSLISL